MRDGREASTSPGARFEDRGEIGRGGMGVVHRVFDRAIGRFAAVKSIFPTGDPSACDLFANEVHILGQLDHPGVVPLYDVEHDVRGAPVRFAMKLLEGRTLAERLRSCGGTPPRGRMLEGLLEAFLRVCDAVAFAHARGVIHRDLKPANVLLGDHGEVYVTDWGLAVRVQREHAGEPGSLVGTPAYMAPEQARGLVSEIDERTDVYGLGGILYEILTLRAPRDGATLAEVVERARREPIPPAGQVVAGGDVPGELARIAARALAMSPSDRYGSVAELRGEAEEFLRGGGWFPIHRFPPGAIILREGERGSFAYIVREGRCEVYRGDATAKVLLREVGPGEVVGEVALFADSPRLATVAALTEVSALLVTREALEREVSRSSWMSAFLRSLAERFAESDRLAARAGLPQGGAG